MHSSPSPNKPTKSFIHSLFDRISRRYDFFNRLSSLGLDQHWRKKTITSLKLAPGMRVLDCASGTGDLARLAAETIVPLGFVAACDISHPMLQYAQRKFARISPAHWHIQMVQARAESLPFAQENFDAATMGFALRNVAELETTFQEFYRVLKPGGRLSLLEFGRPQNPILRLGHFLWLSVALPVLGLLTTGAIWPFLYLRRSILRFMDPSEVVHRLRNAGFAQVKAERLDGGIVVLYQAIKGDAPFLDTPGHKINNIQT